MVYGIESDVLEEIEVSSEEFEGNDATYWIIGDTRSGILLMVSLTRESL